MRGVVVENKDAIEVMRQHDSENTLIYADPPYVLTTRYKKEKTEVYNFEMTNAQHENLCLEMSQLKSGIILSGYDNEIYNDILPTWRKVHKSTMADGAKKREEVLWLSPNLVSAPDLFNVS